MRIRTAATAALLLAFASATALAEGPYGSLRNTKRGIMDGNQVVTEFFNHGMISNWPSQPAGVWPKGTNHSYIDGVALIVSASTRDANGNLIHPMSTQYREFMDRDPETGDPLGWAPLPGYANPNQDQPAMSDDPDTWPWTWPDKPSSWDGYWNGYFGKGVANADLETYFALDDAIDNEYEFYPDSTDSTRRGLGMQVEVRAFQWNHVLAEDCIFWHYDVRNVATTDYDSTVFGMYIDWGIGGTDDSGDDAGSFDTELDLAYAWDGNGRGTPGGWSPVGLAGFAFLESPGRGNNGIDDDADGLVDERRDSGPGSFVFGPVGDYGDPKDHWSGDEDGDWDAFLDLNENGSWDDGEPLRDDVGADGIGPNDSGYNGRDQGEGDGIPTTGEPDFDATDKDESDQIGLTAFVIFPVHFYELINEEQNWSVMSRLIEPTEEQLLGVNLGMYFFSGTFPLYTEDNTSGVSNQERFSMALLFGNNEQDLFRNKRTVQAIYNANYNFAQPPDKPLLTAVPGHKRVTLYWDDRAERSYDRFLQEYDFEGYRIYRSTDPSFIDSKIITDAYGNPTYRTPLAQYDLADGRKGPHLVGVYGAHFDLGEDTGLRHTFVDNDVLNGVTYYYAVVSYDYGFIDGMTIVDTLDAQDGSDSLVTRFFPNLGEDGQVMGIAPTECTSTIIGDVGGNAQLDVNTAKVTASAPAAGYVSPHLQEGLVHESGSATGGVKVNILLADSLRDGRSYELRFEQAETYAPFLRFPKKWLLVDGETDEVLYESDTTAFGNWATYQPFDPIFWASDPAGRRGRFFTRDPNGEPLNYWHWKTTVVESPLVDGISVTLEPEFIDYHNHHTGDVDTLITQLETATNYTILTGASDFIRNQTIAVPDVYELRFYNDVADTSETINAFPPLPGVPVNFEVWNVTQGVKSDFYYFADSTVERGEIVATKQWIQPRLHFASEPSRLIAAPGWILEAPPNLIEHEIVNGDTLSSDTSFAEKLPPGEGDIVRYSSPSPFTGEDVYRFTVQAGRLDVAQQRADLGRVAVVPNPYVATAQWEPRVNFTSGRGPRRIQFINLPQKCTIRIYTVAGYLVDTIEHDAPLHDGSADWDLVSRDGMDIAYGVYLYHVDAPGVGETTGKFAVIK